jgi:transcription initiation factor TFIIB
VPRSLDEIAASSQISRKEIGRTYRVLSRELRLKLLPTSPGDYVSRFCSELKFSGNVGAKTEEIVKEAEHRELTIGCSPMGIAAASLYIASVLCGERRTQEEIANVTGVTAVTIRNRYKELAKNLDIDISP